MRLVVYLKCEHDHYGPHAVDDTQPVTVEDGQPTNFCPGGGSRTATTADLVAVLIEKGGEIVESVGVTFAEMPEGYDGLILAVGNRPWNAVPTEYLIFPIPVSEKDTP